MITTFFLFFFTLLAAEVGLVCVREKKMHKLGFTVKPGDPGNALRITFMRLLGCSALLLAVIFFLAGLRTLVHYSLSKLLFTAIEVVCVLFALLWVVIIIIIFRLSRLNKKK